MKSYDEINEEIKTLTLNISKFKEMSSEGKPTRDDYNDLGGMVNWRDALSWVITPKNECHIANTDAQNKAEGVAQISSYNYIKDIAAAKGMSFYDLVDLVVEDLKAQVRIDAMVKELEIMEQQANSADVAYAYSDAIALLKGDVHNG